MRRHDGSKCDIANFTLPYPSGHMRDWVLTHESTIRLAFFVGVFATMAAWELVAKRRELTTQKSRRWFANLGIVVLDTVLARLIFPTAAVGMALVAAERGWGLLNNVTLTGPLDRLSHAAGRDRPGGPARRTPPATPAGRRVGIGAETNWRRTCRRRGA